MSTKHVPNTITIASQHRTLFIPVLLRSTHTPHIEFPDLRLCPLGTLFLSNQFYNPSHPATATREVCNESFLYLLVPIPSQPSHLSIMFSIKTCPTSAQTSTPTGASLRTTRARNQSPRQESGIIVSPFVQGTPSAECTRSSLEQSEERPASRVTHTANFTSENSGASDPHHIFSLCNQCTIECHMRRSRTVADLLMGITFVPWLCSAAHTLSR